MIKPSKQNKEKQEVESLMTTDPKNEEMIVEDAKLNQVGSIEIIVENYQVSTEMKIVNESHINGDINISSNNNIEEITDLNHSNKINLSPMESGNSSIINLNALIFQNIQGIFDRVIQGHIFLRLLNSYNQFSSNNLVKFIQ